MKKIGLLVIALVVSFFITLCVTIGCTIEFDSSKYDILENYDVYVDYDTCVEYYGQWKNGTTPAYNQDGTLKLNNDCLAKREK